MNETEWVDYSFALLDRWQKVRAELYAERDRNLTLLGFRDYGEYLESRRYWRGRNGIRQRVLRRDRSICVCCGRKSNRIVHHRRYSMDALTGADLTALVTVCGECHTVIERDGQNNDRTWAEKEWVLKFMMDENGPTLDSNR